ncbi:hypothetical protein FACS1894208_08720 [Clostridia bacterium]|nr:hypothetical protein FACS1894208_08720 [Clostridia bacterium]
MEGTKLYIRIAIIALMTLGFAAVIVAMLYGLASTPPALADAKAANNRYYSSETVNAARGELFDRYGRPLVVNELSQGIRLDSVALRVADAKTASPSGGSIAIRDLLDMCEADGVEHTDEFPVTLYPYRYTPNMSAQIKKRLSAFIKFAGAADDIPAEELMAFLRERYKIPEIWGEDDARYVVGVRYETELREHIYSIPAYKFAADIPVSLMVRIKERDYPGVSVVNETTRKYSTEFAAHLLGRVGPIYEDEADDYLERGYSLGALVGKDGLEKAAETYLRGIDGTKRVETNAAGQITGETYTKEPLAGSHVLSSLDIRLQESAERALERGIYKLRTNKLPKEGSQAQGGAAVVIDVKTGSILASASWPTYSLADFSRIYADLLNDPMLPLLNRALQGAYEPGSTFKMCTGIAALESGVIAPTTRIQDKGRYMRFAPTYTPACLIYTSTGGTHGFVNVSEALKVSCNYYYYEAGYLTGIDKIDEFAARFGLGQLSGIEIDGERTGSLAGPEYAKSVKLPWNPGDTIQAAIGQSYNTFTPLQLAVYTATIANGGIHYRPHFLNSVMSYDFQRTAFDILPEVMYDFNFKPENIKAIQAGMRMVAQTGGTGAGTFAAYPIPVACKTGTAQISSSRPDNGVFVGYAPYDNPEIAVAVVVEKGAGGSRVAPIARDIFDAYFDLKDRMTSGIIE